MIQRIQSVWLLLAGIAAFLTLKFAFYSGNKIIDPATGAKQFEELNAQGNLGLLILTVAVGVMSIITVFLFKDRKRQLLLTSIAALLAVVNIILYFSLMKNFVPGEGKIALTAVIAIVVPIFLLLAARNIWKDEKLIKSVDRLR
jgi:dipeptide/tripeptide permease